MRIRKLGTTPRIILQKVIEKYPKLLTSSEVQNLINKDRGFN